MSSRKDYFFTIVFLVSVFGLCLRIYSSFSTVTNFPFAISWSESGRIYNAFQIYASILSDQASSWPWLDPARSLLDGLILLSPKSQLWMWRFWIAWLYIVTIFLTSFLVVFKAINQLNPDENNKNKLLVLILTIWGGLFLFQGPVYYHLLIGIIPVLLFYKHNRPWFNFAIISFSAIWTGLTRVNWFLMPSIVALIYYILIETKGHKTFFQYFKMPILWGVSNLVMSGTTYVISLKLAAKPLIIDSSMNYGFFLSKLWPNDGLSSGLIIGITIILLPAIFVIFYNFWRNKNSYHWIRSTSILIILIILAIGSTLISLRAGGGYDLHNYDTLMVIILIITMFFGLNKVASDKTIPFQKPQFYDSRILILLIIIPIFISVKQIKPWFTYSKESTTQTIWKLNEIIENNEFSNGENILFLDQRHLVIYHYLPPLKIIEPYEKVELMEMAMAENQTYLFQFWNDMENHKYDLIISSRLFEVIKQPDEDPFWYENNVWSNNVVSTITRFYQPIFTNNEFDLVVLAPKK